VTPAGRVRLSNVRPGLLYMSLGIESNNKKGVSAHIESNKIYSLQDSDII